jgi:L-threonylcarbamoyladenylate synthase
MTQTERVRFAVPSAKILTSEQLDEAIAYLLSGEIVGFPTDTVYGLGALPGDAQAVKRLFVAKRRPPEKAIPILLADPSDLLKVAANISTPAHRLIDAFWPGPLTIVFRRAPSFRDAADPDAGTVAVRVPALDLARDLIRGAGGALAVTSANLSGRPAACTADEVMKQVGRRIPALVDGGPTPGGTESSVIDCSRDRPSLLREGALPRATLERAALTRIF